MHLKTIFVCLFLQLSLSTVRGNHCDVTSISITKTSKFIFQYEFNLTDPARCKKVRGWNMILVSCRNGLNEERIRGIPRKGSFCPGIAGCLKMKVKRAVSKPFESIGDRMDLRFSFEEYSLTDLKLSLRTEHSPLLKNWDLRIFKCKAEDFSADKCARDELQKEFKNVGDGISVEVQFDFLPGACYQFDLYPNVADPRCRLYRTSKFTSPRGCTVILPPVTPREKTSWVTTNWWILALVGLMLTTCSSTAAVLKIFTRTNKKVWDSESEMTSVSSETLEQNHKTSVLLLFADERESFLDNIFSFAKQLEADVNVEIHKFDDMRDPVKASDPNSWLMDKLHDKSDMRVLLVWSSTTKRLFDSILSGNIIPDVNRDQHDAHCTSYCHNFPSSFRSEYLKAAIRRIMVQDSAPVYVIRFQEEMESHETKSPIMLAKREFILPQHLKNLHDALKTI